MSEHEEQPIVTPYFLKSVLVTQSRGGAKSRWMIEVVELKQPLQLLLPFR